MFDKYMISTEDFKNLKEADKVTGFQIGMRLPYYRGVVLSLLGETVLTIDGEVIPIEKMKVTLNDKTFPFGSFEDESVERWEFGDIGVVTVEKQGGLKPGDHKIDLQQHMKISYTPTGFWGHDTKILQVVN